jgi:hypothetical protein
LAKPRKFSKKKIAWAAYPPFFYPVFGVLPQKGVFGLL